MGPHAPDAKDRENSVLTRDKSRTLRSLMYQSLEAMRIGTRGRRLAHLCGLGATSLGRAVKERLRLFLVLLAAEAQHHSSACLSEVNDAVHVHLLALNGAARGRSFGGLRESAAGGGSGCRSAPKYPGPMSAIMQATRAHQHTQCGLPVLGVPVLAGAERCMRRVQLHRGQLRRADDGGRGGWAAGRRSRLRTSEIVAPHRRRRHR